jgi:hypothetical protein
MLSRHRRNITNREADRRKARSRCNKEKGVASYGGTESGKEGEWGKKMKVGAVR